MQPFFTVLLSLLLAQQVVEASPIPKKREPKSVTLPLNRHKRTSDLHPTITLQQQINRADRRLARMTRRQEPTHEQMTARLQSRVDHLHARGLEARYNRFKPKPAASSSANPVSLVGGKNTATGATAAGGATAQQAAGGNQAADPSAIGGPDSASQEVTISDDPKTDNSLALDIEGPDVSYSATVQIGTPPRPFLILMDSGSADFWVASENCQSEDGGDCGKHQPLGPQTSTSFKASNTPFQVKYGTGAVAGTIIQDDIDVAGLKLAAHTFGVAEQETVEFSADDVVFDGLMGLAQSTLSQQKVPTPVEALAKAGDISDAIVTYRIPRFADNKKDGQITFGAVDTTLFDPATLATLPNVNKDGFWEAAVDAITVDGQAPQIQGERKAILDTGTTLIVMPQADAEAVIGSIQGAASVQGQFTVPCDTTAAITMTFGGKDFSIDPRDLATQDIGGGNCLAGIQAGNIGGADEWLVGDVFLKNVIFATDVGKNEMNLAVPV